MARKLQVLAFVLGMLSYTAYAGTNGSIGTASTRGDMRVDTYTVKGDATLFNGSIVETSQTSAEFRLDQGVDVQLSTVSSGTLFGDHMVLNRGVVRVNVAGNYPVQARGLQVKALGPNSTGTVAMVNDNTVEVASIKGDFVVMGENGAVLANLHAGEVRTFAAMGSDNHNNKKKAGGLSTRAVYGIISVEVAGGFTIGLATGLSASH